MELLQNINFWQLIATLLIAVAVHHYGKQNITMSAIAELREKSDAAWKPIKILPKEFHHLDHNQRDLVAAYLNEYEHFCSLYNERIINRRLVRKTRKDTIIDAYNSYSGFIKNWRENQSKPDAWKQLQICASSMG